MKTNIPTRSKSVLLATMLVLSAVAGVTAATSTSTTDDTSLKSNITVTSLGLDIPDSEAKFRVTNDGDQNVTLSWTDNHSSGTVDVAAHGTSTFLVGGASNQTSVLVKHNGTIIDSVHVSDKRADFGYPNTGLTVYSIDNETGIGTFRAENYFVGNTTFRYEVNGTDQSGTLDVDEGTATTFNVTLNRSGSTEVLLFNNGRVVASKTVTLDNNSNCDDTRASITFDAQSSDGDSVMVQHATLEDDGYIVLTDADGNVVGQSDYLEAGTYDNVTIELDGKLCEDTKLKATLYADSNGNKNADWSDGDSDSGGNDDSSSNLDQPVMNGNASVSDWGCINIE